MGRTEPAVSVIANPSAVSFVWILPAERFFDDQYASARALLVLMRVHRHGERASGGGGLVGLYLLAA